MDLIGCHVCDLGNPGGCFPVYSRQRSVVHHFGPVALKPSFLSIIIPAHNEEIRLPRALEQAFAFLEKQDYSSEVVVVENGSSDRTLEIAQSFFKQVSKSYRPT